ncbi:iron(III) transport system substrate-binding protein [Herminiimonas fonticola]|uniref:Iron(III) transport system substrate-binding protein n=2 Tax=Herminiimonas fonticola TaxID=303380 RepID=A0A4R6G667_9BURK|nr:ABC-type Fe3+ transport system periplasmic component [Herminiimonas fonticola]TDN90029.1 iron(III) transport system substrate-binding protein [Herminiimonas fonticola]
MRQGIAIALTAFLMTSSVSLVHAQEKVLNLYSARHYQTDEVLYSNFTKQTGIKINRIEADDNALFERIKNEGKNSPADVIVMVDAARIWRAEIEGFFQPVQSKILNARIPANLRGKDDGKGPEWFGFSTRARVIVYNKATVKPADVATYESLADPVNKGKVCTRSGSHPYNLSLIGSMIERDGEKATEQWAKGMVANFARPPRGGDTDQIKGVASGECGVAIANSYYYVRLLRSTKAEDIAAMKNVGFIWPNAQTSGTHFNIAGGGVAKHAPHREAAVKFLEYLASDEAQGYFAEGNNEWPVVKTAKVKNETLESLGKFKMENVSVASIGKNQIAAQRILDRVSYK